jgi:hypothetical protein
MIDVCLRNRVKYCTMVVLLPFCFKSLWGAISQFPLLSAKLVHIDSTSKCFYRRYFKVPFIKPLRSGNSQWNFKSHFQVVLVSTSKWLFLQKANSKWKCTRPVESPTPSHWSHPSPNPRPKWNLDLDVPLLITLNLSLPITSKWYSQLSPWKCLENISLQSALFKISLLSEKCVNLNTTLKCL